MGYSTRLIKSNSLGNSWQVVNCHVLLEEVEAGWTEKTPQRSFHCSMDEASTVRTVSCIFKEMVAIIIFESYMKARKTLKQLLSIYIGFMYIRGLELVNNELLSHHRVISAIINASTNSYPMGMYGVLLFFSVITYPNYLSVSENNHELNYKLHKGLKCTVYWP